VLLGEILVVGSVMDAAVHFAGSSATVFAATEHLASASSIVVVASEIGGAAFASASVVGSSAVAWKLVTLWEARPNVAPRGLSMEWHLPFAILFHFLDFVFNNNDFVDRVLEIGVVSVEQLDLNIIIQSLQKHVLLLFVTVDVFSGISEQLNEWVEVLIHCHAALLQISDFFLLQFHGAAGYIVVTETSLELIPRDGVNICMGVTVCLCNTHFLQKK
jgi:hypothetical protein